ncbi:hypothetical protein J3D46_001752 [Paenarthrobacter sp. A20]|nr:hypothetical protein [Paenarthrobacter sp. A20]
MAPHTLSPIQRVQTLFSRPLGIRHQARKERPDFHQPPSDAPPVTGGRSADLPSWTA